MWDGLLLFSNKKINTKITQKCCVLLLKCFSPFFCIMYVVPEIIGYLHIHVYPLLPSPHGPLCPHIYHAICAREVWTDPGDTQDPQRRFPLALCAQKIVHFNTSMPKESRNSVLGVRVFDAGMPQSPLLGLRRRRRRRKRRSSWR